jgi:hypothetical protein
MVKHVLGGTDFNLDVCPELLLVGNKGNDQPAGIGEKVSEVY